jgi:hypothetical protein
VKTVTINKQSKTVNNLLAIAKRQNVVVQTPEGDEFLVVFIDDFDHELARQRCNEKLMVFLDKRYRAARHEKGIPLEEMRQKLGLDQKKPSKGRNQAKNGRK